MFGRKVSDESKKQKEMIDKDLELYKREKLLEIKEEISKARAALTDDWSKIEHDYHSARQVKETEVAKLDALIEAKKAILAQDSDTGHFLRKIIEIISSKNSSK